MSIQKITTEKRVVYINSEELTIESKKNTGLSYINDWAQIDRRKEYESVLKFNEAVKRYKKQSI